MSAHKSKLLTKASTSVVYRLYWALLQKTLNINTMSMDQLRQVLFGGIHTVRVSDSFTSPEMATDLMEHDLKKLNVLHQRGKTSFGHQEAAIKTLLS